MELLKIGLKQGFGLYVRLKPSRASWPGWRISVLVFARVDLRRLHQRLLVVVILAVALCHSLLAHYYRSDFLLLATALVNLRFLNRRLLVFPIVALHDSLLARRFRSDFLLATVLSARNRRSRSVSNLLRSRRLALGGASDRRRRRAGSSLEGGGRQQAELLVVVLAGGVVSDVAQRRSEIWLLLT
jgi:hypothetical protein